MPGNPSRSPSTDAGPKYSEEAAAEIYSRILRVCVRAGLGRTESEDVAQDIWTWLLRSESPCLALTAPWLSAVAQNFVLRYRRRTGRLRAHEGVAIDAIPEPGHPDDFRRLESREVLDRMAGVLPPTERHLLALIRDGHTLAGAARILGIPRGSRAFYRARLVRAAREAMTVSRQRR